MAGQEELIAGSVHSIPTLINQFIATVDKEDEPEACQVYSQELSNLINQDELTLLGFIQNLGSSLTSDSDNLRTKSVQCLSSTLGYLVDSTKLSKQDINVLVDFLLSKFDDKVCLQYVLGSVNYLIQFKNFIPSLNDNLKKIFIRLLKGYDPKKNLAKVRFETFQILATSLKLHLPKNEETNDLFIKSFIHIASGEKDPRNLLISFELNSNLNSVFEFDTIDNELHKEFINDLFDVCFCYFPISFTPPANDPYKITAGELKSKLRATIASQSLFAKDSFSNLIEKLTSTNAVIRNDTLKTILLCVENYSTSVLEEFWLTLWNALKFEILHNDISEIFKSNLNTLIPDNFDENIDDNDDNKSLILTLLIVETLIGKLIHESNPRAQTNLNNLIETIQNELKDNLSSVKDKSKQSTLLLATIASISIESFNKVISFLFSYDVWGKYVNIEQEDVEMEATSSTTSKITTDELEIDVNQATAVSDNDKDLTLTTAKQRDLVDNFGYIFIAYQILTTKYSKVNEESDLGNLKDYLLIFMGQLLMTSSSIEKTLRCKVIQQLSKLISLPKFLTDNEVELILGYFKDILISTIINQSQDAWENDLVVKEIIKGVITIAETQGHLVIDLIISELLNLLDGSDNTNVKIDLVQFNKILNVIGDVCINYQILEVLSIRLLNKIQYIGQEDDKDKSKYIALIIELFLKLINKIENLHQFLTNTWYKSFLPKLLKSIFDLQRTTSSNDYVLIELVGDLFGLIIRFIDKSKHQEILSRFENTFITSNDTKEDDFNENLIETPSIFIGIWNKMLSNLDNSVKFQTSIMEVSDKVIQLIYKIETKDEYLRIQYLQNLSLLYNKFIENDIVVEVNLEKYVSPIITTDSKVQFNETDLVTFEIFIWILKALVIKMNKSGITYLYQLLDIQQSTSSTDVKQLIGKSLKILFIDLKIFTNEFDISSTATSPTKITGKNIISKVKNLNVKLLYKQQIFEIILPRLISNIEENKTNENNTNEIYLNSLSLILEDLPKKILLNHLTKILPLVLTSLTLSKSQTNRLLLSSSLTTLNVIIEENPQLIENKLSVLIPILLKLSVSKVVYNKQLINSEEIRVKSLTSLIQIFKVFKTDDLHKFKQSILKELVTGLDDKKRTVRKLVCDLRQSLYEL
ncbi:Dos2-interacting transcription regulator of RNA-Pol-II-domain-containing protein [Scheffersomyces coipomensis]|uniref:Dos2-interacting transcription regulator of RNA-Pol-II-domain-containing protein n=1 Tax=Scheffersomyces coipomensis TaxID=1788519 RepID=UPI00315C97F5